MKQIVSWWEIQVPDVDVAKKFYGEVFGWTFKNFDEAAYEGESRYVIACVGDDMVGGIHQADGGPSGRRINVVFDADARDGVTLEHMLETVTNNGGTVLVERTAVGEGMGWFASVADPSGLRFDLATDRPRP